MFIVAIVEMKGQADEVARALASELATTPYELKLAFNAGLPAVIQVTADEAQAQTTAQAIRRHGHWSIVCDRQQVVASSDMTTLRNFHFEPSALVPEEGSSLRLEYQEVTALLRANHRTASETTEQVKERKLRPVMAVMTGGLVLSKTTERTVTSNTTRNEQVLYLFSRTQPPWLLRERSAQYLGLGAQLSASSFENFGTTIQQLRQRCTSGAYDERLKTSRPIRGVGDGVAASDIYAHLLAQYLSNLGR